MSKALKTKKRILALLMEDKRNLVEICKILGLAQSTVSQHLKELRETGAIQIVDNAYFKRWKYYQCTPEFCRLNATSKNSSYVVLRQRLAMVRGMENSMYTR